MYSQETSHFVDDLKQGHNNIMVTVRVRPLNQKEQSVSEYETVKVLDDKLIVLLDPNQDSNVDDVLRRNRSKEIQFAFDYVFDQHVVQQTVFEQSCEFLISGLFDGYNATIFSYGATGSGKTFTYNKVLQKSMIGNHPEVGVMPRAMHSMFQQLGADKMAQFKEISVKVSYLEIYNENIKDLLTNEDKNLDVREDKHAGIVVAGITEVDAKSVNEVMALLKVGNKNRAKEATDANKYSSRSHAILQVQIDCKEKNQGLQENILQSKLSLVDLAGSERASNTNNKGIRMVEGAKINQSLLVLGNCIQALSDAAEKGNQKPFIPYRNSKLTRLLKDSLGGNCRTVMIANVSPSVSSFEETYNTLVYANRAKNIKTVANRNVLNAQNHISNYAEMIKNLRQENEELKHLIQNGASNSSKQQSLSKPATNGTQRQQQQELDNQINNNLADLLELQKRLFELEDREDNYKQNLQFLKNQQKQARDNFEQMRLQDRIDNCQAQMVNIAKLTKEISKSYDEHRNRQDEYAKRVSQYEESAFRNYLQGLIKQGDLQLENQKIKQQDKRNRVGTQMQEQHIMMLKNQLQGGSQSRQYSQASELTKLPYVAASRNQVIPGVNSPYPKANYVFKQQYLQKRSLKLPPINLLNINKMNPSSSQRRNAPQSGNPYQSIKKIFSNPLDDYQYRNNPLAQPRQAYGQRSPSYAHPPTSSKSLKGRQSVNQSVDYLNTSDDNRSAYSAKRLKQMHDQYQQQRFNRAASGKRNQNSMPSLSHKVLMPGMVHESPYVKNFQKDQEPAELKRHRLQQLNNQLKNLSKLK